MRSADAVEGTVNERMSDDAAGMPLPGEVLRDFPQLREKAAVDVVNGLEVVDDHLEWQEEDRGSFLQRLWDGVTGASARRQQSIDRGVQGVLSGMNDWLQALHAAQYKSDIAMERVAKRLSETRQGVMRLQTRHEQLRDEVAALGRLLGKHVDEISNQISDLQGESARGRAWDAVARAESRWGSRRFDAIPPLLRVLLASNELYWSDFGAFLRLKGTDSKDACELVGHSQDILANLADRLIGSERSRLIIIERCLESLEDMTISADWRDAVAFLLEGAPRDVQPLAAAAAERLQGSDVVLHDGLPRLVQPRYLGELAMRETVRRIESEQLEKDEVRQ